MRALLLAALAAPALAGCLAPAEPVGPADLGAPLDPARALVAHAAGQLLPLPPGFESLRVRLAPTGFPRGEPTLGVTGSGAIFTIAGTAAPTGAGPLPVGTANTLPSLARSRDHGATWERVWSPLMGKADVDPWVWVDEATDRVYHGPLYIACSWLAWSDDEGETWDANPAGGCGLPGHDHQKITTGPPPEGIEASFPSVVYYSYNSFRGDGTVITRSLDGGRTFSAGSVAHPEDRCYGGLAGSVAVAPDGTAYSPKATCDGVRVAASRDAGLTWELLAVVEDEVSPHSSINPEVLPDAAGNLYVLWNSADNLQRLAVSRDGGATFGEPLVVPPPGVRATLFGVLVAGAPGRLAIAYLGTDADPSGWEGREPSFAPDEVAWHLYLAFTEDALASSPVFVTLRATPEDDPVQRGCVWLRGGTNACRNLRDFMDLQQRDGRAYLAVADGCDACSTAAESRRLGETTVALVEEGPSLLGGLLLALGEVATPAGEGSHRDGWGRADHPERAGEPRRV